MRLNKHGSPYSKQDFSQMVHSLQERYKNAQRASRRCLIELTSTLPGGRDFHGVFEVVGKASRANGKCQVPLRREDTGEDFQLTWDIQEETNLSWVTLRGKCDKEPEKTLPEEPVVTEEEFLREYERLESLQRLIATEDEFRVE